MIERVRRGEELGEEEIRRDMEMVGLRKRTGLTMDESREMRVTADVGWFEALFGRKRRRRDTEEEEEKAMDEWAESGSFPNTPLNVLCQERRRDPLTEVSRWCSRP